MRKKDDTVRYTAKQLADLRNRGETRSNWAKAAALTNEEIEAQIAADPDEAGMVIDWDTATVEMPQPRAVLNMRIDRDVLEYFRKMGKGYQTRINAVLRSYVDRTRIASRRLPFFSSVGFPAERQASLSISEFEAFFLAGSRRRSGAPAPPTGQDRPAYPKPSSDRPGPWRELVRHRCPSRSKLFPSHGLRTTQPLIVSTSVGISPSDGF